MGSAEWTARASSRRPTPGIELSKEFRIPHSALRIWGWGGVGRRKQRRAEREPSAGGVVFRRGPGGEPRFLLIRDSYRNWGFPKGHLEPGEPPADAARREVAEETGLKDLVRHGPIRVIDWYFRFRGKTIHKFCHFFLFESKRGECVPQEEEGITDCAWYTPEEARRTISYDNARAVLEQATAMVQALAHVVDGAAPERAGGGGGAARGCAKAAPPHRPPAARRLGRGTPPGRLPHADRPCRGGAAGDAGAPVARVRRRWRSQPQTGHRPRAHGVRRRSAGESRVHGAGGGAHPRLRLDQPPGGGRAACGGDDH